jgi:hypothetical protein
MENQEILNEIDLMHQRSNKALVEKNINVYINIFSDELKYKQLDGKIIDKKQLVQDIRFYFSQLKTFRSQYERMDYSIKGNQFTERLIQKATASIKVFLFFTKKWNLEREGIYEWIKIENVWRIEKVEILNEKVY